MNCVRILKTVQRVWATRVFPALLGYVLITGPAMASTIGDLSNNIKTAFGPVADLIGTVVFIIGLGMGAMGVHKFRQNQQSHQSGGLGEAASLVAVGSMLVALPLVLGVGVTTIFSSSGSALTATSGMQSIK